MTEDRETHYVEEEDDVQLNGNETRHDWWRADLNYLPIHIFQKEMKKIYHELSSYPSTKQVNEMIEHVNTFITKEMMNEFYLEYEYSYGKGVINWADYPRSVQTGYIDGLKMYLSKLLCVFIQGKHKNKELCQYIVCMYDKWFSKTRYWDDYELNRFETIINKLRMDASQKLNE